jgi:hypothetical protein
MLSQLRAPNQAQDGGRADRHALALSDASSYGSADLEPELTLFSRQTN